jgi:hypothetical protein
VSTLTADRIRNHATKLGLTHLTETITQLVERAETTQMGYLDFVDLLLENDKSIWPHCAGLIWPHPGVGLCVDGSFLGACAGEPVAAGAGLDDVGVEGEPVDDGGGEPGSVKVLPHSEKGALEAQAMEACSSLAVMIWNSSSAPRGSKVR